MVGARRAFGGIGKILTFKVDDDGVLSKNPITTSSPDAVPFGFTFDRRGHLLVTETAVGAMTSYNINDNGTLQPISLSVSNGNRAFLSDQISGLVGGLGLAPGANIGEHGASFEAVHGTAPDLVGKNAANPSALILAACMLLDHLGDHDRATRIRRSLETVVKAGKTVTRDLGGTATTTEFTDAIIAGL